MTSSARPTVTPFDLGAMPKKRWMCTVDEMLVRSPLRRIFEFAREVDRWPEHLPHYRYVRFHQRASDGGGLVGDGCVAAVRFATLADVVDVGDVGE